MRLLLTLDFPPDRGGIQTYLYGIVKHCFESGDRVLVAGVKDSAGVRDGLKTPVRYVRSILERINRKAALAGCVVPYLRLCVRERGRLRVSCGNVYAAVVPWLCMGVTGTPYDVYTYGTELIALRQRSWKSYLLLRVLRSAHRVYTLGSYSQNLLGALGVTRDVEIVPPRIEPRGRVVRTQGGKRDGFSVLTVGRLVPHKGHDILIRAVAELAPYCNCTCTIVGAGPGYAALQSLCVTLRLGERIRILRDIFDADLGALYARADAFVLPSRSGLSGTEGFGIVLLEAMAYRVPVIASDTGGIPEVLDYGKCGILVEPGNTAALARAIAGVAAQPGVSMELAENAWRRLQEHYVWQS
jgi:phosphatidylinositol alpha-1,6-mannosyltransferase